jgi:uncharacterized protein
MLFDLNRLSPINAFASLAIDGAAVRAEAGPSTNAFINPADGASVLSAPVLAIEADGDFVFSARVKADLATTYDAAGLFVFVDDQRWLKVVRELTDLGHPAIVSVVTDGVSDDANGERWDAPAVWIQVVRRGALWCLHFSADGENWRMTRYLGLDWPDRVRVGLTVQSPMGAGCAARFDDVRFGPNPYGDVRAARV